MNSTSPNWNPIDRDLIRQIVREVRDEIVDAEWVTVTKLAAESGQSRRKIETNMALGKFRTRLDGGLRMIHVPSWNDFIANCPETGPDIR